MRVTVKSSRYKPEAPHAFNARNMLPATDTSNYASEDLMLAVLMSEAFVRHRSMAYARGVWPRVGTGPLPGKGAGLGISDVVGCPSLLLTVIPDRS